MCKVCKPDRFVMCESHDEEEVAMSPIWQVKVEKAQRELDRCWLEWVNRDKDKAM